MIQKYSILATILFLVVFSGCVSKKKFLEMEAGRLRAETLASRLNDENKAKADRIEVLIDDFETMKNELLENNAIKEQAIDSLNETIFALTEDLEQQMEIAQRTSTNLSFEQRKLNDELNAKDRNITNLQKEITRLENEITEKNDGIDQRNFEITRLKDEATVLNRKIQTGEQKLVELQNQLKQLQIDTETLKKQISEKDETILRLENNVKLLKNQLGQ
ncbi:MAG: hypothetical protein JXR61_07390 [Prolixibacteraceae bacterium]|nr:hypothetical protein [Prolixibacteraceae bacterium]